jgi:SAM-dependent methyltransferase
MNPKVHHRLADGARKLYPLPRQNLPVAATRWNSIYATRGKVESEPDPLVAELLPELRRAGAKRILDLGCGTGRHSALLLQNSFSVTAADASGECLEILKSENAGRGGRLETARCDMETLPFSAGSFDAVLAWDVLAHGDAAKIRASVREMRRVLGPGGLLLLAAPSTRHPRFARGKQIEPGTFTGSGDEENDEWNDVHHFFSRKELKRLLEGFEILQMFEETRKTGYNAGGIHWLVFARKKATGKGTAPENCFASLRPGK